MNLAEVIKGYLTNSRKATPEELIKLNKISLQSSNQPTVSAMVNEEQQIMPVRLTPEQIRYNVNMKLYGRPNK